MENQKKSISGQWGAYNDIERLVDINGELMKYEHHTVNHKVGFVNFENPWIHTQTIERHWDEMRNGNFISFHVDCTGSLTKKYKISHHFITPFVYSI